MGHQTQKSRTTLLGTSSNYQHMTTTGTCHGVRAQLLEAWCFGSSVLQLLASLQCLGSTRWLVRAWVHVERMHGHMATWMHVAAWHECMTLLTTSLRTMTQCSDQHYSHACMEHPPWLSIQLPLTCIQNACTLTWHVGNSGMPTVISYQLSMGQP